MELIWRKYDFFHEQNLDYIINLHVFPFVSAIGNFEVLNKYEPTWSSIDTRPLPDWYDEAKIGIFLHWGVYSVPNRGTEWFWYDWKGKFRDIYE